MKLWQPMLLTVALLASCAAPPLQRVLVDTPNSCFKMERVEGDRVYLTSGGQRICLQVIGHVPVDLDPSVRRIQVFTNGTFWMEQDVTPAPADGQPKAP
jgi:hypothetical protein